MAALVGVTGFGLAGCGSSARTADPGRRTTEAAASEASASTTTAMTAEVDEAPCHVTGTVDGAVELTIDADAQLRQPDDPEMVMQNFSWEEGGYTFYLTHNFDLPHVHGGFIEDGDDFVTGGYGFAYQPANIGPQGGTAEGEYFADPSDDDILGTFSFTIECES